MTRKEATRIANESVGNYCQSSVLTMISNNGQRSIPEPAQRISGYEIIQLCSEVELMLIVGGESVIYDSCFNFSTKHPV